MYTFLDIQLSFVKVEFYEAIIYSMIKKIVFFIYFIINIYCIISCENDGAYDKKMNDADALLEEFPDSAYTIIKLIDPEKLKGEDKARYSVLKTASLVKQGLEINIDSSMNDAYVFYCENQTPSREAMLTHFIKAFSSDSAIERLEEYDNAIKYASGKDSLRYVALAYTNKALIYHDKYDYEDEIMNIQLAEKCICDSLDSDVVNHIYGAKGLYYLGVQKNDSALFLFEECLRLSKRNKDDKETLFALKNIAFSYQLMGNYEMATEIVNEIITKYEEDNFLNGIYPLVLTATHNGKFNEALQLLGNISDAWNLTDKLAWYSAKAEIESLRGDFKEAYEAMNSVVSLQNEQIQEILKFDVTRQERDHQEILKDEALVMVDMKTGQNQLLLAIIVLGLISFIVLICFIREKHKRKECELKEEKKLKELELDRSIKELTLTTDKLKAKNDLLVDNIISNEKLINSLRRNKIELEDKVNQYRNMISENNEEKIEMQQKVSALNKNIESLEKEISVVSEKLETSISLMKSNFQAMHEASAAFCNANNSSREKKCIAELDVIYHRYRDSKVLESLEREIDRLMEGIISIIRDNLSLSEDWIRLLIYDICGFNYISISVLMNISEKNASVRRSRLKEKCRSISNDNLEILKKYIPMLSDLNTKES